MNYKLENKLITELDLVPINKPKTMSKEVKFAEGVYVRKLELTGENGPFTKTLISIEMKDFTEFAKANAKKSETNGKYYLNLEFKESKEGNPYIALNEYEPKKKSEEEPWS